MANPLGEIIKKIIEIGNDEIFHDSKRFNALLDDLAPELMTERRVFHRAITDEVLLIFHDLRKDETRTNEFELLRIKGKLETDYGLSEAWSVLVVSGFADAFEIKHSLSVRDDEKASTELGSPNRHINSESSKDPDTSTQQRRMELLKQKELLIQERSSLGIFSHKRKTEIDRILVDIDSELGFVKTVKSQESVQQSPQPQSVYSNAFQLTKLEIFSSDGTVNGRKVSGSVFLSGETKYIGIRLHFATVEANRTANLVWNIYRENGTSLTGNVKLSTSITPTDQLVYQQWGWPEVGNWSVGRYKIVASINGCPPVQGWFEIKSGQYGTLPVSLRSVRLFSGSNQAPSMEQREYTKTFSRSSLKYVYFQFEFPQPNRNVYSTFDCMIKNEQGDIITNFSQPCEIQSNWGVYWSAYGWDEPGKWIPGRYTYVVSFGKSKPVMGTFDVI